LLLLADTPDGPSLRETPLNLSNFLCELADEFAVVDITPPAMIQCMVTERTISCKVCTQKTAPRDGTRVRLLILYENMACMACVAAAAFCVFFGLEVLDFDRFFVFLLFIGFVLHITFQLFVVCVVSVAPNSN
jgi:hypothetical protein